MSDAELKCLARLLRTGVKPATLMARLLSLLLDGPVRAELLAERVVRHKKNVYLPLHRLAAVNAVARLDGGHWRATAAGLKMVAGAREEAARV